MLSEYIEDKMNKAKIEALAPLLSVFVEALSPIIQLFATTKLSLIWDVETKSNHIVVTVDGKVIIDEMVEKI